MSKRYTVSINYGAIRSLIDNHRVYRGNNTSFCIDMGFENRTSWISDLKRGRNLPSPEEAAKMCIMLNTTPEEILLHEGANEAETAKCQADIELVRGLVDQNRPACKKNAPTLTMEDERITPIIARIIEIVCQLNPETQEMCLQYFENLLALQNAAQEQDTRA